jgi:hypothetical protein
MEAVMLLICPFCNEQDFDRIGLKRHLILWCEEFAAVDDEMHAEEARRKEQSP